MVESFFPIFPVFVSELYCFSVVVYRDIDVTLGVTSFCYLITNWHISCFDQCQILLTGAWLGFLGFESPKH